MYVSMLYKLKYCNYCKSATNAAGIISIKYQVDLQLVSVYVSWHPLPVNFSLSIRHLLSFKSYKSSLRPLIFFDSISFSNESKLASSSGTNVLLLHSKERLKQPVSLFSSYP